MYDYKVEEKRKEYERYVEHYQDLIHLIDNIKYATKKDGKTFQSLVKNIDLSDIKLKNISVVCREKYYSRGEKELHFSWWDKYGKYQEYNIDLQTDFDIANVDKNRIIEVPYIRPFYNMELEDLKKILVVQRQSFQNWMDKDIQVLKKFDKAIAMAKKFEKDFKEKYPEDSLWYIVKDCLSY